MNDCFAGDERGETDGPETIGVILVHGIGEQRRYEHLDGQIRGLIKALGLSAEDAVVSVEIVQSESGANRADQDSWKGGVDAPIRIHLDARPDPARGIRARRVQINVHEVWWADVNEPYSVTKQLRFWLWGNTVWNLPKKLSSRRPFAAKVYTLNPSPATIAAARLKIFAASNALLLATASVGILGPVIKRLLGIEPPVSVQVFTNFLSSIKLYNQRERSGLGLTLPPPNADFLDALDEPPRVSIRRRMVQSIADVAGKGYHKWYILAHSLGSVVAFNGLMEPAYVFANYLDEKRWKDLKSKQLAGPTPNAAALPGNPPPAGVSSMMPRRPLWIAPDEVAYRPRIFRNFGGLVTYGSPIGKFGAIWPARAPVCLEPAFSPDSVWLNIFDPIDPVSGPSDDYNPLAGNSLRRAGLDCCPRKIDVGYAGSNLFGVAHVEYFADTGAGGLAYQLGKLILGGDWPPALPAKRFYDLASRRNRERERGALASWIGAHLVIGLFSALSLAFIGDAIFHRTSHASAKITVGSKIRINR